MKRLDRVDDAGGLLGRQRLGADPHANPQAVEEDDQLDRPKKSEHPADQVAIAEMLGGKPGEGRANLPIDRGARIWRGSGRVVFDTVAGTSAA